MKTFIFLLIPLLCFFFPGLLQGQDDPICKAPVLHPDGMKALVQKANYHNRSGNTLYIPLTIHILGTDEGAGYYPFQNLLDAICQLNQDFAPYDFHFYLEAPPNYVNRSEFYHMADGYRTSEEMDQFIVDHNNENTLNIYIVWRTEETGGSSFAHMPLYETLSLTPPWTPNFPKDHAIVVRKAHLNNWSHLLAHEVGHYFSLWHTFFPWDLTVYDALSSTPDSLTLELDWGDSTYVFEVMVELVSGVDCENSGDFICDTPPDYLSTGFYCNVDMLSTQIQLDPDSVEFQSDGTYFMSYSDNDCQSQFSPIQVDIMRYYVEEVRNYLLYDQTPPDPFQASGLTPVFPSADDTIAVMDMDSITLEWDVPGADYYVVNVGRVIGTSYFPQVKDLHLSANHLTVKVLPGFKYYWSVLATSRYYPCEIVKDTNYFYPKAVSATAETSTENTLRLFPNPATERLHWRLPESGSSDEVVSVQLYDTRGQLIRHVQAPGKQWIDVGNLPAGVFFIQVVAGKQVYLGKFLKQ